MNKYEHIIVPESIKRAIKYSPRGSGGGGLSIPMRNDKSMQNIYKGNLMLPEQMTQMLSSK